MGKLEPYPGARSIEVKEEDELSPRAMRELRRRVDDLLAGRVNWNGEFTLTDDAVGTIVYDDRVTPDTEISLSPLTEEAVAMLPKVWIGQLRPGRPEAPSPVGEFLVRHSHVDGTNCKYRYSAKG